MPRKSQSKSRKKRSPSVGANMSSPLISRDQKNGTVTVSLRLPASMLKEIDKAVKTRPYRMPRHMWLLEAVHEKLNAFAAHGSQALLTAPLPLKYS
jgi:hypothetical protein